MWLRSLVFLYLTTNHIFAQQNLYPGDSCTVKKDGSVGVCKLADDCEDAVNEIKTNRHHSHLRCGFVGVTEVVCCAATVVKSGGGVTTNNAIKTAENECAKLVIYPVTNIIGGKEVKPGEFPHAVALGYPQGDGTYKFDCGGTVIAPRYILTAGHCVWTPDGVTPAIVRAGIVDLGPNTSQPDTDYVVEQVINHPNYTRSSKYDDIALLRLGKPLPFNRNINAACLETNRALGRGQALEVSGWGLISNIQYKKSSVLLKTTIKSVLLMDCAPHFPKEDLRKMPQGIIEGQFCAGDEKGGHDTCEGDSGGPATITTNEGKFKLVGVTSFGRGCGSTIPAIYTRVAYYIDWIVANVWGISGVANTTT